MAKKKTIFQGKIIQVDVEQLRLPDGLEAQFEIVRHPGGAAVMALDQDDRLCLLRQYRPLADAWLWELPAGKIDNDEPPLLTAQRELLEEAGVVAQQWQSIGTIYSSPGVFTEIIHLYLAQDLSLQQASPEAHEHIEIHWIPFPEALSMAQRNEIQDAKTLVGLLRAQVILHVR